MNRIQLRTFVSLWFLLPNIMLANTLLSAQLAIDTTYWQCTAHDANQQIWSVNSIYDRVAKNKALDACKKTSKMPSSCQANTEDCTVFAGKNSTRPMWQCTALDGAATTWKSSIYPSEDNAALAALSSCKKHSHVPESCYINELSCSNRNSH